MIIAVLLVVGLCMGSFVNALVWRLHEQESQKRKKKQDKKYLQELSVLKGRSMCPSCKHGLGVKDLIPVLSWLSLGGKCRYCKKPISAQYPVVELATAALFVGSYIWRPMPFTTAQTLLFVLWLPLLVGFMALIVYDFRWMLLPNRIVYPLAYIAGAFAVISVASAEKPGMALINTTLAVIIGGGLFYALYQVSNGKWIGGGDVRLGWILGLIAGTPARSALFIFIAALLGTVISLPLMASHKMKRNSIIPFGPFLIIGLIIVQLFGHSILFWYQRTFLGFTI